MQILRASVLVGQGADQISLHTDQPCPFVPECLPEQPNLVVQFEASRGRGVEYVRENFGIEPKVIQLDSIKFGRG